MFRYSLIPLMLISGVFLFAPHPFAGGGILTKVLVRVISRDAKVIGSGVGGASVQIVDQETGEILAQGEQAGGTGDTERIMVQPHQRGKTVYGTPGAAFFMAQILLERPTRVEIRVKAPLSFPQALQSGVKTMILIPGKDIEGEGVVIELEGLIVQITQPSAGGTLRKGEELRVGADVKML
jgi:hypothetical protein